MSKSKSGLIEKLKGLYEKRNSHINGLESYRVPALRQLIKAEEATWMCRQCGHELSIMEWGKEVDLITCDNSACNKYRNPVGTIKK